MLCALFVAAVAFSVPSTWITVPKTGSAETARWLWTAAPNGDRPTSENGAVGTFWFKTTFAVEKVDTSLKLWVAADNHAEIWINGTSAGKCDDYSTWTKLEIGKLLRTGANEIRVKATNDKGTNVNPGGVIAKIPGLLNSDSKWQVSSDESFTISQPAIELGGESISPWNLSEVDLVPPLFRRDFVLSEAPKTANLRIIGLGDYRLFVNGNEVSQDLMLQTWSQYDKTLYWRDFDVSRLVQKGANTIGVMMGNSFWYVVNPGSNRYFKGDAMPQFGKDQHFLLSCNLDISTAKQNKISIETDSKWKWARGPITFSHVQAGEDFDARLLPEKWSTPKGAGSWLPVQIAKAPPAALKPNASPAVQVHEVFTPKKWIQRPGNKWSIDFGQNCSGIIEIELKGKPGQAVTMRPSEVMTPSGDVQQLNLWGRSAHVVYTLASSGKEVYRWKFFYHGFRYLELVNAVPAGKPNPLGLPVVNSIKLLHIRASNPIGGTFECSSKLYNDTVKLIDWAMKSNMVHVMSDCPHREKMGWLECSYLLAPSFSYIYDCEPWLAKISADIRDNQRKNGMITTVAPRYLMLPDSNPYAFTVEWGAAGVLLPWHLYNWYGDRAELKKSFASMKAFVDYVESISKNGIGPTGLGDWYDYGHGHGPGPSRFTPTDLTSTATQALCIQAVIGASKVLGAKADEAKYTKLYEKVRKAFQKKFYDSKNKTTVNLGSPQSGTAMALEADLIPKEDRATVLLALLQDLKSRGFQQTPGDVGHVYFVRALSSMGRSDVLHQVYSRTGTGSYGGILAKGMTTLPETWDAITAGSNSLNHCMLGHAIEFFYGNVLGIQRTSPGWKTARIAPDPGILAWAKGQVTTPQGVIQVSWAQTASELRITASVPRGCTATLDVPSEFSFVRGRQGTSSIRAIPGSHEYVAHRVN